MVPFIASRTMEIREKKLNCLGEKLESHSFYWRICGLNYLSVINIKDKIRVTSIVVVVNRTKRQIVFRIFIKGGRQANLSFVKVQKKNKGRNWQFSYEKIDTAHTLEQMEIKNIQHHITSHYYSTNYFSICELQSIQKLIIQNQNLKSVKIINREQVHNVVLNFELM